MKTKIILGITMHRMLGFVLKCPIFEPFCPQNSLKFKLKNSLFFPKMFLRAVRMPALFAN